MIKRKKMNSMERSEAITGYLFASPWIIGLALFTIYPIIAAIMYSFMDYNILQEPSWLGVKNYVNMVHDKLFWKSLGNTFYYVIFSVPLSMIIGLAIALLLNMDIKGMAIYRTLYYMPSIVPLVAGSILWSWIFNPNFGILTNLVESLGLESPAWLADPAWAKPSLILMSLWGAGGGMIIYLAGLKNIPDVYYEAADLDGAGSWTKFVHITLPMLSPTLFFQLIMGVIGSFQVFTQAFIMTNGGPNDATLFYVLYLYQNAFQFWKMGYASALAWVLFAIIMFFTWLNFKLSNYWVFYEQA
ncbi:carbohydrate ABC transporter permease [Mahella australiensis]|uniref:Carbohydrate ABC transporter membrane protein 1, CUT1 family n=1 Tax=Mahella australiensis (strain DSM 15567 / CIP 107919 / 50-1 BON) TaxID=697281 RepID=F4A327_MAHA5|nr:sugar ABC transporter permease [Mahella australiensis]AEE95242.1 carbohydrate ABC transporter membrane protein 1, CUT1 family [Mahella australiensis 50-1 BON]